MTDDILIRISEDLGEIKATLKGVADNVGSHNTRITELEAQYHDVDKKQYGMLAVASVLGGICGAFWDKLFS